MTALGWIPERPLSRRNCYELSNDPSKYEQMCDEAAYHERALQLAKAMFAHCSYNPNGEGIRVLHPANENGFSDPCDALVRLGVMKPHITRNRHQAWQPGKEFFEINVLAYEIARDWTPEHPLNLMRHPGDPSYRDLLRALCQQGCFHGLSFRELGIDRQVGQMETEFIDDLVERGLGIWSAETGFVFDPEGRSWNTVSDDYWRSRLDLANELGSEEALFPSITE